MARTEAYQHRRESIDPDDYTGRFALWSGTSFSAPLFAGSIAQALGGIPADPADDTAGPMRSARLDGGGSADRPRAMMRGARPRPRLSRPRCSWRIGRGATRGRRLRLRNRHVTRPRPRPRRSAIELSLAYVEAETGQQAAALARCQTALALEGISDVTRGLIWSQLGLLHMRTGDGETALAEFAQAIDLLEGETEHHGRALLNQGSLRLSAADAAGAARDLRSPVTSCARSAPRSRRPRRSTTSATPVC